MNNTTSPIYRLSRFLLASCIFYTLHLNAQTTDDFPNRPIRMIVGSATGATTDIAGRITADVLSKKLGQSVFVVNQPGATGTISVKNLMREKPDGYNLVFYYSDQLLVAPLVFKELPYDSVTDVAHVGSVVKSYGFILAVPPTSPATNFNEFIQLVKTKSQQMSYGTWGIGSSAHLGFELLNTKLGAQMVHIPYKGGGPSYQAAMAGEVDVVSGTSFVQLLKAGKLRPLVIGGTQKSQDFPELPTMSELGYSDTIFAPVFYGIVAPPGTPKAILDKIRSALAGMNAPDVVARLASIAVVPAVSTSEEVIAAIRKGRDTYKPIVEKLGLVTQ
ncbi:MAG: tripartite tricarboxylate transporter substrate binding protein [Betaproteobacteria bacterium]|nr:tripartite tricarboxylate transporter substrate binding protein [Betaproteobacteria bacterium]